MSEKYFSFCKKQNKTSRSPSTARKGVSRSSVLGGLETKGAGLESRVEQGQRAVRLVAVPGAGRWSCSRSPGPGRAERP